MEQANLLLEGKYEILAKIREGGMGTIYKVRHRLLDEIRVVKVMRASTVADADLKRRFLEEARTAIRLKHPNICSIYDFAADDNGTAYLVMEYIDGITLAELLKSGGLPAVPLILQIAHQALCALGYLHRRGVIHRDVAPDNLMLTYDEEHRAVVKLIDLGIAKIVDREMDLTATGVFLGKPKYASPEQFGTLPPGERLDGRSDLYGLGVVLYELLTGIRPYAGKTPLEILRAQHLNLLIPFEESDPMGRVAPLLRAIVFKALQRQREDRFATAEEFDRELMRLLDPNVAPHEHAVSPTILSTIRDSSPKLTDTPTPSAQDRLNRHFGDHATPSPSSTPLLAIVPKDEEIDDGRTVRIALGPRSKGTPVFPEPFPQAGPFLDQTGVVSPDAIDAIEPDAAAPAGPAAAAPARAELQGSALPVVPVSPVASVSLAPPPVVRIPTEAAVPVPTPGRVVAPTEPEAPPPARESLDSVSPTETHRSRVPLVACAAVALAILLVLWHPWNRRSVEPVVAPPPRPTSLPALTDVEVAPPPAPPANPGPAAAGAGAAPAADSTAAGSPGRRAGEAAAAAREQADAVRGTDFAPTTYRRAIAKQTAATDLEARGGSDSEVKALFDEAAALFTRAAEIGKSQEHPSLFVEGSPQSAAPASKPTPLFANPTPLFVAEQPLNPAAAAEARKQIVQAVGDYAWARRTRNERLLVRVFPSAAAAFQRDLARYEKQDVRLDVQSIDVQSSRATAAVNETVISTGRDGAQTQADAAIELELAKRGGRWVIVARR